MALFAISCQMSPFCRHLETNVVDFWDEIRNNSE